MLWIETLMLVALDYYDNNLDANKFSEIKRRTSPFRERSEYGGILIYWRTGYNT